MKTTFNLVTHSYHHLNDKQIRKASIGGMYDMLAMPNDPEKSDAYLFTIHEDYSESSQKIEIAKAIRL